MNILKINDKDTVVVTSYNIRAGNIIALPGEDFLIAKEDIPAGHKVALRDIEKNETVVKYGLPIGEATQNIDQGEWVHTHNIKTSLDDILEYSFSPESVIFSSPTGDSGRTFLGYQRKDGNVGIRNEIWIIPTVNCVNRPAELIANEARKRFSQINNLDGIYEFKHPYGCSQIGEDHMQTQKILANLIMHSNAGGVLVLGLGCENNQADDLKKIIRNSDDNRVKYLVAQEVDDEVEAGLNLINELVDYVSTFKREPCSLSELNVGLECGGSDAFSGITANPLVGSVSDMIIRSGGTAVLTEVPEMFGAETMLMNRAKDITVYQKIVHLINDYKAYFMNHKQPIYENPSYGNKLGGISTLEEKSLGCIQKGGTTTVNGVLKYGELLSERGLNLLSGPGNDNISCTALAASGCQIIIFTTGRGTPLGSCVPTLKIASNSELFHKKTKWIDFNAGQLLEGKSMTEAAEDLFQLIIAVAGGSRTKAEEIGFREIAILNTGITF